MNPATLALIVQYIGLAIAGARELEPAIVAAKNFIDGLFAKGQISAEQQQKVKDFVDAVAKAGIEGEPPPAWEVEPDPQ